MIDRIVYVGQNVPISALFTNDSGGLLQPSDANLYPNYTVLDIDKDLVAFGIGTLNNVTNVYEGSFTVPIHSKISSKDQKWVIEWELIDTLNKSYKYREFFDVAYPAFKDHEFKEQKKVTLSNIPLILHLPIPSQASNITFGLYDMNNNQVLSVPPIQEGIYNEFYLYKVKIPANSTSAGSTYSALWKFTIEGVENAYYTTVDSIDLSMMKLISDLRLFMDKVLKPIDLYLGYRDSELRFFIENGIDQLNMMVQWTNWNVTFFATQQNLKLPLLYAAAWFGLNVQFMAEADSVFSYGGQAVTLDVDRTGYISEQLERLKTWLDDNANGFAAFKKNYLKSIQGFHLEVSTPTVGKRYGKSGISNFALNRAPWLIGRY